MKSVHIIGAYSTSFGKLPDRSYSSLADEAVIGALQDAGMADGSEIESIWFGNCTLHLFNQPTIRGQACLSPLMQSGVFKERTPIFNVDNACATGSTAVYAAANTILAGRAHLTLALGVEKLFDPNPGANNLSVFEGGFDQLHPEDWREYFGRAGAAADLTFSPGAGRAITMDSYAMQALYHMKRFGSTREQIAIAAAQAHNFGADNELAQYRFRLTPQEVLADRVVSEPLTRAMCAPIGDGAAALVLCSGEYLRSSSPQVLERAVKVRAMSFSGGKYRSFDEPGLSFVAAQQAYEEASVAPEDIDLAEVHDATSFSVLYQSEMLGFCEIGEGGRFVEEGETGPGGRIPVNTSGGLVSKGHPVGATGVSMLFELARQLRGEAGVRQVKSARLALAENGGGVMGFDEAVCAVTILERA